MKIAAYAVQTFAHHLFSLLDETDNVKLMGTAEDGTMIDLKRYTDLFASEPGTWFEVYSKYGSITGR